jgi:flagellar biosynthesis GTPase FlhF
MDKNPELNLWEWVKAICSVAIVGVVLYKIYITPFNITVDFPTLLSLLLALFSVALASLFYFKATETSNTFYDNTYNFTKDIAQILVKIESGFGERLKHLDEGYTSMRDHLQRPQKAVSDLEAEGTKQRIREEKKEIEKVISERNQIISDLVEKSEMQAQQKEEIIRQLYEKEAELSHAQSELEKMNRRLVIEKMKINRAKRTPDAAGLAVFTRRRVISLLGEENVLSADKDTIKSAFDEIAKNLPRGYLEDMENQGYFDHGLTDEGYQFLINIVL